MIFTLHKIYSCYSRDRIKEHELGGAYCTHWGRTKMCGGFWWVALMQDNIKIEPK
jgi:hypothetical protein